MLLDRREHRLRTTAADGQRLHNTVRKDDLQADRRGAHFPDSRLDADATVLRPALPSLQQKGTAQRRERSDLRPSGAQPDAPDLQKHTSIGETSRGKKRNVQLHRGTDTGRASRSSIRPAGRRHAPRPPDLIESSNALLPLALEGIPPRAIKRTAGMPVHLQAASPANWLALRKRTPVSGPALPRTQGPGIRRGRLLAVQAITLLGTGYAFCKFNQFFGGVAQPFRIGNDWRKDNALHFDELLHFQGTYRLTRGLIDLYRWAGLSGRSAEWFGAGIAAATMTYLEYIDGRRPNDEASYSDITANLLGVAFALLRPRTPLLRNVDVRISYERVWDPFSRSTLLNYDRMTHWLSYDLQDIVGKPVTAALGYGVSQAFTPKVKPHFYLGVGMSLEGVLGKKAVEMPVFLRWLNMYQFGLRLELG